MKGVVFAGLTPHPPVLVPEVGTEEIKFIENTKRSMESLAKEVKEVDPDLIITISPHGQVFSDAVGILSAKELKGDFSNFGRGDIELSYNLHEEFTKELAIAANSQGITVARVDKSTADNLNLQMKLDYGVLVPMYYLEKEEIRKPIVPITIGMLSYEDLYKLGKIIQLIGENKGYKVAVIASGDLSHRLKEGTPGGFDPKGEVFDKKVVDLLDNLQAEGFFDLDSSLIEKAGECGLRSIMIMLGALDRLEVEGGVLSYEGPFGVGYAVACYKVLKKKNKKGLLDLIAKKKKEQIRKARENESEAVRLARKAVEEYLKNKEFIDPPAKVDPKLAQRGGTFVSIKKDGVLRGCIGSIQPTTANRANEIIKNALEAAFKDPRFKPVNLNELENLVYTVDVLGEVKEVDDLSKLDPKEDGILVEKDGKRGILLPNLAGVDSVSKQLEIAKRKAGIPSAEDDIKVLSFKVDRYE
ncbi:AmmeMemoRadiSam system protein A [Halonatronum saccharophilum]|uniref:AmmeMemoRadiSam system protein A n=1 Tax=Halonatronum saccharophilum TaxID=150060 RepID=UPI000485B425|nr:AmmeMemoRadiSam system protein A [Halonatronum saccharophilum]